MLDSAALILTDPLRAKFDGVDLAERAALAARQAGIDHAFFAGHGAPSLTVLQRLRARGVFGQPLLGWPRVFAGLPAARTVVVLDARTVIEPEALTAVLRFAEASPEHAALAVAVGPRRKDSVIRVDDGHVTSVIGDGNAANMGIAVIPEPLVSRVRGVCSMQDAIHRLAKAGDLRAMDTRSMFVRRIRTIDDLPVIEHEYRRHRAQVTRCGLIDRSLRTVAMLRALLASRSSQRLELSAPR